MTTALITGVGGFVGRYLCDYLSQQHNIRVIGVDITPVLPFTPTLPDYVKYRQMNLTDAGALFSILEKVHPDYIFHLAAFSSVGRSWEIPADTFTNNTNIFLNLVEAVRVLSLPSRILSVGSSEEYGGPCLPHYTETSPVVASSPYAVARISQEMLSKVYADHLGVDVVMTRSFNHFGPRQREQFAIPSFVKQIVEIKKAGRKGVLRTGNTDIVRDFLDVRDVIEAYYTILTHGKKGDIYNVCSGKGTSLNEIIHLIANELDVCVECRIDEKLIRPVDNPIVVGDNTKLCSLGWQQNFSLETTLRDMIRERTRV